MYRPPSNARHRRRQMRLARTVAIVAVFVILIAVLLSRTGGNSGTTATANTANTGKTSKTAKTSTTPTTSNTATTLASAPTPAHVTTSFMPKELPTATSRASVVLDGSSVLILGGLTSSGSASGSTSKVLRFDPATGAITADGQLAAAVHDAAAAVVGGRPLVFGGGDEVHTVGTVQAYVGQAGQIIGHLPQSRSDLVAATVGSHTYVLGGFDGTNMTPDVLQTDDGITFKTVTQLPVPVRYPGIAVVGNVIYLFGGQTSSQAGHQTGTVQAVDVVAGTARVIGNLPQALTEATAWVQGGAIFLAGGRQGSAAVAAVMRFDPTSGQAVVVGNLPRPTADAPVAVVGDVAYLFGGEGAARLTGIVKVTVG